MPIKDSLSYFYIFNQFYNLLNFSAGKDIFASKYTECNNIINLLHSR